MLRRSQIEEDQSYPCQECGSLAQGADMLRFKAPLCLRCMSEGVAAFNPKNPTADAKAVVERVGTVMRVNTTALRGNGVNVGVPISEDDAQHFRAHFRTYDAVKRTRIPDRPFESLPPKAATVRTAAEVLAEFKAKGRAA
jgi:hypothetical protein